MNIRELYEWACSNHLEDAEIKVDGRDGYVWTAEIESANADEVILK